MRVDIRRYIVICSGSCNSGDLSSNSNGLLEIFYELIRHHRFYNFHHARNAWTLAGSYVRWILSRSPFAPKKTIDVSLISPLLLQTSCYAVSTDFMQRSFERLIELLGKGYDSHIFQQFVDECGDKPLPLENPRQTAPSFYFEESGFTLVTGPSEWFLFAHIDIPGRHRGEIQFNAFPSEIKVSDHREDVLRKLNMIPFLTDVSKPGAWLSKIEDHYKLDRVIVSFGFDPNSHEMISAAIWHASVFPYRNSTVNDIPTQPDDPV